MIDYKKVSIFGIELFMKRLYQCLNSKKLQQYMFLHLCGFFKPSGRTVYYIARIANN